MSLANTLRRLPRSWLLRLVAAALALVVTVVLMRQCYYSYFNFVKEDEIRDTLPAGSTPDEIFAYLESEGIEHSPGKIYSASQWSVVGDLYGVPNSKGLIVAIVRNTPGFIFEEVTNIFFVMEGERLERIIFDESCICP